MTNQSDFEPLLPVNWAAALDAAEKKAMPKPILAAKATLVQAA